MSQIDTIRHVYTCHIIDKVSEYIVIFMLHLLKIDDCLNFVYLYFYEKKCIPPEIVCHFIDFIRHKLFKGYILKKLPLPAYQ